MTRKEFLTELDRRLSSLPREEVDEHLNYYAEMLADRIEEGMSEEAAVDSMESLDTITARILGARAFTAPPKTGWRKWGIVAIVAAAALILPVIAIIFVFSSFMAVSDSSAHTIGSISSSPMLPSAEAEISEMSCEFPTDGISGIQIAWVGGSVTFETWNKNTIHLESSGSYPEMYCTVEGDTLLVKQEGAEDFPGLSGSLVINDEGINWGGLTIDNEGINWGDLTIDNEGINWGDLTIDNEGIMWNGTKIDEDSTRISSDDHADLTVYLPRSFARSSLDSLEIGVVSAAVDLKDINAEDLTLTSISGNCTVSGQFEEATLSTTSGRISFEGSFADGMFNTVSGDLSIAADEAIRSLEINAVSGDTTLTIPAKTGFELEFDSVSGDFGAGDFDVRGRDGKYTCGSGAVEITADTVSGDLSLIEN